MENETNKALDEARAEVARLEAAAKTIPFTTDDKDFIRTIKFAVEDLWKLLGHTRDANAGNGSGATILTTIKALDDRIKVLEAKDAPKAVKEPFKAGDTLTAPTLPDYVTDWEYEETFAAEKPIIVFRAKVSGQAFNIAFSHDQLERTFSKGWQTFWDQYFASWKNKIEHDAVWSIRDNHKEEDAPATVADKIANDMLAGLTAQMPIETGKKGPGGWKANDTWKLATERYTTILNDMAAARQSAETVPSEDKLHIEKLRSMISILDERNAELVKNINEWASKCDEQAAKIAKLEAERDRLQSKIFDIAITLDGNRSHVEMAQTIEGLQAKLEAIVKGGAK